MKRLIAITACIGGIMLVLVPRFILPACEYEGYSRMHCSDTAQAEYFIGGLLTAIGIATWFIRSSRVPIMNAILSAVLFGLSFWVPEKFGFCQSPRMPCNYGMVPGIRFISIIGMLIMIGAIFGSVISSRKKGNA